MENKELKKEYNVGYAEIDDHILKMAQEGNILLSMKDSNQMNRVILNGLCEMLSQVQAHSRSLDSLNEIFTIAAADKMNDFFTKARKNFDKEVKRVKDSEEKSKKRVK